MSDLPVIGDREWRESFAYARVATNHLQDQINAKIAEIKMRAPVQRKGDWMQTFTGVQFWPLDPHIEEINILDIAHALANTCRFGGHCKTFYSVAEHSVHVASLLPPHRKMAGLLHDASEAYLVDVPRPIKSSLTNYKEIERNLAGIISTKFGSSFDPCNFEDEEVKWADNAMLATESEQLLGPKPAPWSLPVEPANVKLMLLSPQEAEDLFIKTFYGNIAEQLAAIIRKGRSQPRCGGSQSILRSADGGLHSHCSHLECSPEEQAQGTPDGARLRDHDDRDEAKPGDVPTEGR